MIKITPGKHDGLWGCHVSNGHMELFILNARPSQIITIFEKPPTARQILATLKTYLTTEFTMNEETDAIDARITAKLDGKGTEQAVEEVLQHG